MTGRRVLVLRALGLGDLLTAVPALRALRRALTGRRITLAAPAALAPLAGLTGAVDDVLPARGLRPLPPCGPVDLAVNLHGRGPQSHRVLRGLHPVRLLAFAHPGLPDVAGPPFDPPRGGEEHEVARWCRLLASFGFDPDPGDLGLAEPDRPSPAPGAVVVHPGAGSPARRWPPERFARVAAALRADGHRVVVTGGPGEAALAARVAGAAGLGPSDDLSGRTGPLDLAALVAHARLVVCGDTGTGHLATAYRTPSVLLFGPTPPAVWGPPPGRAEHRVLWAGRRGDPHGPAPDPGLLEISVPDVLDAARGVLEREGGHDEASAEASARGRDRGRGLPRLAPVRGAAGPGDLGGLR
ncbi:glycosyltransferase family 9 protein [Actinomadura sp. NBRC 104425]|uniref:glycosyltransferase family 9 protein n=1 Tax=Actinomadura sp. NBRC 104425 TaxID=3032204 RepID=UPI0025532985|nr:glycosyltransferase family 9 protein [Actinomadura sp. NBRC 104425]